tara:strand:+ start:364 stop:1254 length:891 start_codon:yes stop_codon:yes gene_type:complete
MDIRIGTSEINGTFHRQGEAVANLLRETYTVETKPMTGSSVGSALGLHSGELQFGFSASNWIGRALRGESPFKEPIAIRMAAPANVGPMFFVVREDSDLYTIDDMKGRKVAVNFADSGMYQHTKTIFQILGISFDDFEPIHIGFSEGAQKLSAGEIDAQWQCPIPNPVMTELANSCNVRVLIYSPGQLETVLEKATFYRQASIPVGAFRGVVKESAQVGVLNVIATHERVDNTIVRDLVGGMIKNANSLGKNLELYKGLEELFKEFKTAGQDLFEPGGVSLHSGAVEAYREAGLLP